MAPGSSRGRGGKVRLIDCNPQCLCLSVCVYVTGMMKEYVCVCIYIYSF